MKHVREDMPDLQSRRPEASATLASVLDRMTDKDLKRRYPDIETLVTDLEEALAIEAARSGKSTGEATAVLRTLPESTRRRLPFRMRHPLPVLGVIALLAVLVAIVALLFKEGVDRAQKGTGSGTVKAPAGETVVSVGRASAHDYDPLGDDIEHHSEAPRVVDRDPGTVWTTESYSGGLAGSNKDGVGVYLDAKPGVEAVRMVIQTPHARLEGGHLRRTGRPRAGQHREWLDQARRRARARRGPALPSSTPAASAIATTSSGSPSSRRTASASRSASSPSRSASRDRDSPLRGGCAAAALSSGLSLRTGGPHVPARSARRRAGSGGRTAPGRECRWPPTASDKRSCR